MKLADLEAAIITEIKTSLTYLRDCETISNRDLGDDGMLTIPPAVRIAFSRAPSKGPLDVAGQSYSWNPQFTLLAVGQNLRGQAAAKTGALAVKGAYDILDDLRALLPGKKLDVGAESVRLLYAGEELVYAKPEHTVCALGIEAVGHFVHEET